jgi:hypothetical protein
MPKGIAEVPDAFAPVASCDDYGEQTHADHQQCLDGAAVDQDLGFGGLVDREHVRNQLGHKHEDRDNDFRTADHQQADMAELSQLFAKAAVFDSRVGHQKAPMRLRSIAILYRDLMRPGTKNRCGKLPRRDQPLHDPSPLEKLFRRKEGEYLRTCFVALYLLFILFAYYILKPVSRALFLNQFDIDKLPYLMILIAFVGGFLAYLYTRLASGLPCRRP